MASIWKGIEYNLQGEISNFSSEDKTKRTSNNEQMFKTIDEQYDNESDQSRGSTSLAPIRWPGSSSEAPVT